MTRPYSMDLRERAVARVLAGESVRSVAASLRVAISCVVKWSGRYRHTGSVAPSPIGGFRGEPALSRTDQDYIRGRIKSEPHVTLRGLQGELAARGTEVSYGTVRRFVHRQGLSFKKNFRGRGAWAS